MTGSGKTTLARELLAFSPFVLALDYKGLLSWEGYERYTTLKGTVDSRAPKVIYAPNESELRDAVYHDKFFEFCYKRGNTTVYVDEVYGVAKGNLLPPHYHAILTRGREHGISTYSSTQRPMSLPNVILSESEHWYIFRLTMPGDRKKVEESVAVGSESIQSLKKREFYYVAAEDQIPIGPLILDLPKHTIEGAN